MQREDIKERISIRKASDHPHGQPPFSFEKQILPV